MGLRPGLHKAGRTFEGLSHVSTWLHRRSCYSCRECRLAWLCHLAWSDPPWLGWLACSALPRLGLPCLDLLLMCREGGWEWARLFVSLGIFYLTLTPTLPQTQFWDCSFSF